VVLLPYRVPVGSGNGGWQKQKLMRPPEYPREARERWPVRQAIPVRDMGQVKKMIANAKRTLAEQRASRLLRELGAVDVG
jgi:hypothetical protein